MPSSNSAPRPAHSGSTAQIDFQGISIDALGTLTVRSGASGQSLLIRNADAAPTLIAGALRAEAAPGFAAPRLYVSSPAGINVLPSGTIDAPAGLTVDSLGATPTSGQPLVNEGVLNGGNALWMFAANVTGGGQFRGDAVYVSTFGNANNPVNGLHYLDNGLQFYPGTGSDVLLTLNDYGSSPQFFNFEINGNGTIAMPSAWPAELDLPQNNLPVLPNASTPGPPPAYGGGSMIIQASGTLTLSRNASDFVFPGGIVLKAGATLDLAGVIVDNGWTGAGVTLQGVFFEAPNIVSTGGDIQVFTQRSQLGELQHVSAGAVQHLAVVRRARRPVRVRVRRLRRAAPQYLFRDYRGRSVGTVLDLPGQHHADEFRAAGAAAGHRRAWHVDEVRDQLRRRQRGRVPVLVQPDL